MTTTFQDQYVAVARNGQAATLAVVDAWTKAFQDVAVKLPEPCRPPRTRPSTRSSTSRSR